MSINRACSLLSLSRSMWYYKSLRNDDKVILKLNELSSQYPTRGFEIYYRKIRAEGIKWNRKKVLRVYRLLKLKLRTKRKRRLSPRVKQPLFQPLRPNMSWSMDYMGDALESGRRLRILNIIDDYNRAAICMDAQFSHPAQQLVRNLECLRIERGLPQQIRVDNGPEFISHCLRRFCEQHQIKIHYIQPGKPTQNAYIERFNRSYREDILDAYLFQNIQQLQSLTEVWRNDYNNNHPHGSLNNLSPVQYASLDNSGKQSHAPSPSKFTTFVQDNNDNSLQNSILKLS